MAFPPATQTVAMIIGTMAAAAGLNLGVMSLGETTTSAPAEAGPVAVETEAEVGSPETGTAVTDTNAAPASSVLLTAVSESTSGPVPASAAESTAPQPVAAADPAPSPGPPSSGRWAARAAWWSVADHPTLRNAAITSSRPLNNGGADSCPTARCRPSISPPDRSRSSRPRPIVSSSSHAPARS